MSATRTPSYCRHKGCNQAIVVLNGRMIYLGKYGTAASRAAYDRTIAEWLAGGRRLPVDEVGAITVSELAARYYSWAKTYYVAQSGNCGELGGIRLVLGVLRKLYGSKPVTEFGPLAMKATREQMIKIGWCRSYINSQVQRARRMFKWGVQNELVPADIWHGLQAIDGLRRGKTTATESAPVKPVSEEHVEATLPYVSRHIKAVIQLQLLTGARPTEILVMRGTDLDTTGELWTYKPKFHKTEHHGHSRAITIGPKARVIVEGFLRANPAEYLFSPKDADAEHRQKAHEARKTPLCCGNVPGSNKLRRKRRRSPGDRFTVNSYRRCIERACDQAFPLPDALKRIRVKGNKGEESQRWEKLPEWKARLGDKWADVVKWREAHRWHPHQLRHTAGTKLRREFGLDVAQAILGHRTVSATQVYCEINSAKAAEIMSQVG